ncbi:MAG: pyruvate, phosphate dikinase [Rickettsiales bacterium]|nr:pyruvate, phosphate dikinase [Rickettsiales bacterium]MDG4545242.1 pyruvate, phosphate dikinase [Rickettsiales bacterium]MDG4547691.1 pyruvate, phosphate dikinase [Rickettsiales bacterium]
MGITHMNKWVYNFGDGSAEGNAGMKELLGGKGANLAEMCSLGLPVPPGFTITTEVCTAYYENNRNYPADLEMQVNEALTKIEDTLDKKFGDAQNPLLVSVRSGARASMPGMMDTVLNLGLNDATVEGLAQKSGNERFAYDSYRRFIQMYSDVVLGVDHYHFEDLLEQKKQDKGVFQDTDLDSEDLKDLVSQYKLKVEEEISKEFPQDVNEQIWGAINAVFGSWMNSRAKTYRRLNEIPESWGTAVNIQSMVFGNMGSDCATGVAFTRNPSTGDNEFYGEYLVNAQGEDVVAGIRTPQQITIDGKNKQDSDLPAMEEEMNDVYKELVDVYKKLEKHYKDMQDIEFTVQDRKLWILQTRNGKRTAAAAIKIAVDMVNEGIISKEEAISRIDPASLDQLLHPTLDPKAHRRVIDRGLPASPGAASGAVVFTAEDAERKVALGDKVILVRIETSPEDIHGMHVSEGILTARGGMTSHAAVVARGMGKPCVSGAGGVRIDYKTKTFKAGNTEVSEGDIITIDGSSGEVILGSVPTIQPNLSGDFSQIMKWADDVRDLKVRTNAETPEDAATARKFGAEGIGLCRTEHMFFDASRIVSVREMILAENEKGRRKALAKLLPMQREDFVELFNIMEGLPVTIRLLDPPLHEFLPHTALDMEEVAKSIGVSVDDVKRRASQLAEHNPMLGHRGCRLGITYPEIYEMQSRAIFEAAVQVSNEGTSVIPEVMIPLALSKKELEILKAVIVKAANAVFEEKGKKIDYLVGTMIELPRAALKANELAEEAEFFSFGTNDLTQTTLGISRDDSASFIGAYKEAGIFEHDPFVRLDREGVGELISIAATRGRKTRKDIKLGICGEHGGNPDSVHFCQEIGLNYVSCSPYRVPIARLAAAQAALANKAKAKKVA